MQIRHIVMSNNPEAYSNLEGAFEVGEFMTSLCGKEVPKLEHKDDDVFCYDCVEAQVKDYHRLCVRWNMVSKWMLSHVENINNLLDRMQALDEADNDTSTQH